VALETGTFAAHGLLVAGATVVHLHAIPAVLLKASDVLAPDITAVAGDPVLFIGLEALGFADVAMTLGTLHLRRFHMGGVGEEDTIGLPGVNLPGNLFFLGHILIDEDLFGFTLSLHLFVTLNALRKGRNTCIGSVIAEEVTAIAVSHRIGMRDMTEVKGLLALGVEKLGEDDPPDGKACGQAYDKKEGYQSRIPFFDRITG